MSVAGVQNRPAERAAQPAAIDTAVGLCVIFGAHVLLAWWMYQNPRVATYHALAILALGGWHALTCGSRLERVAYVAAYVMAAEVLWRMCDARVFWEYGKYAVVLMLGLAVVRARRFNGPPLLFAYFALLLPSALMLIQEYGLTPIRRDLSFNLSGPLALMVCAWFFSQLRLSDGSLRQLFAWAIAPVIGVLTLVLLGIVSAPEIRFTGGSLFELSGGFGPNQVATTLALGALLAFLYALRRGVAPPVKLLMLALMLLLAVQSALTFSRGGLYGAVAAGLVASLFLFQDTRVRMQILGFTLAAVLFAQFLAVPMLNQFTGGAFARRWTDTSLTHREEIARTDLLIWRENPILGVGPGQAGDYREEEMERRFAAHTELSRLMAEHGAFGFLALLALFAAALGRFRRVPRGPARALPAALFVWAFLYMVVNAMRTVSPAFTFGLAFVTLASQEPEPRPAPPRRRRSGPPLPPRTDERLRELAERRERPAPPGEPGLAPSEGGERIGRQAPTDGD